MKTKPLYVLLTFIAIAPCLFGVEPTPPAAPAPAAAPIYTLAFSDDFSTNPNRNGQWTVFRRQGDPNREGSWDPIEQVWYLTRQHPQDLATAAFANYELTARVWKVNFNYKVDNGPEGGDGFVFMFYKDKSAYGTPDSGSYKAFQTRNPDGSDYPVRGYGLQFDTYQVSFGGCDRLLENYVGIIQTVICRSLVEVPFGNIDDATWHSVEFTFDRGQLACTIDGETVLSFFLSHRDYSFTGIGFGAGTGGATSNQIIDDFQIWVAD